MKVVNFETLRSLPVGTVFTKYPLGVHEMLIRGEVDEHGDIKVQRLSDPSGDGSDELFDDDVTVTGASFPIDTDTAWFDSDINRGALFVVYEIADVNKVIDRLNQAVKDSTHQEQAEKLSLADTWVKMDPKEKASTTVEQVLEVVRVASKDQIEAILTGVPLEISRGVLEKISEQLTGKPLPTAPGFEIKGDVMDLIKNVGGPDFNEAFNRFNQTRKDDDTK